MDISDLFNFSKNKDDDEYIEKAELHPSELILWESLSSETKRLRNEIETLEYKKKLWWLSIEKKYNLYSGSLKIEDGKIFVKKK